MSNWREQLTDEGGAHAFSTWLGQYYHYLVLVLLAAFAFWNRARNWENFIVGGEVLFRSNDPWYHYRSTRYVVENFPQTMPFDAWTHFPIGTTQSQFGTIFDQTLAVIALVAGLGNPSDHTVRMVVLFGSAIFGTAVLVPAYLLGRRLGGRFAGIIAAGIVAIAPDGLLARSVVGFADHHAAEALFQALAVLGIVAALYVAQRDRPVYELLANREFGALRRPLGWSVLAGVGIGLYLWVWPPGVLLLGILGTFFLIHLSIQAVKGESPEHTALVGVVSLTTAGLMQLSTVNTLEISATSRSLLQPGLAFAVAFGCLFMAWFFRQWEARSYSAYGYPAAIAGILVVVAGATALLLPDLFGYFVDQVLRVIGFQTSPTAGTVGEAQPLRDSSTLFTWYRLALFTALGGVLVVLYRQYSRDRPSPGELLVAVWFVFIMAATFTQSRFSYYLAVPVAVLTAITVGVVMQYVGRVDDFRNVEAYQVMVVFAILLVTIAPLAWGGAALASSDARSQPGGIVGWNDGLEFMDENTPEEGQYANPDGEAMEPYDTYQRTDDFDYEQGAYGVMSWWDYGHWITAQGNSIPNANPFQQGTTEAARFLTSQNESDANGVLESIDEDDAKTRYVMIDWKMAETETQRPVSGKYFAPIRFNPGTERSDFYTRVASIEDLQEQGLFRGTQIIRHKQAYYDSTMVRLYNYHGSAVNPEPWVLDWEGAEQRIGTGDTVVSPSSDGETVKRFESLDAARQYVENDTTAQVGGFGPYPSERVPALEQYRLVHTSRFTGFQGGLSQAFNRNLQAGGLLSSLNLPENASQQQIRGAAANTLYRTTPSWVKTFERVPGATIEGSGPANATLRLSARMEPENAAPFTYTQQVETDTDGEFTTTVPYSTTGYDELGPEEGYTNVTVRGNGSYQIASAPVQEEGQIVRYSDTVDVTESQVVGEDDSTVTATLESQVLGNLTQSPDDSGDGTTGDGSTDGETSDTTNSVRDDVATDSATRVTNP